MRKLNCRRFHHCTKMQRESLRAVVAFGTGTHEAELGNQVVAQECVAERVNEPIDVQSGKHTATYQT